MTDTVPSVTPTPHKECIVETFVVTGATDELERWLTPRGWHIDLEPSMQDLSHVHKALNMTPRGVQLIRHGRPPQYALAYPGDTVVWDGGDLWIKSGAAR